MEGSHAPPPFLSKTYEMVEDPVTNSIVSWSQGGHSFVVWNPPEFAQHLLPKYFKHNNFSSFVRQLNTYGFRKVDPDLWEFANEEFIRGQRHLLKHIHRRKPIHSHSAQNQGSSVPLTDSERQEFEEEIQRLKHEKSLLQLQLQRHKQEKQEFELQVRSVGGRLHAMEHRQGQMMHYLAQELQKPSFASSFMQQSEIHNRKRRLLVSNCLYDEANVGEKENQILTFNMENADSTAVPVLNLELIEKLDSSLNFWQNFLYQVGRTLWEEMHDCGVLVERSDVITTNINALSRHFAVNVQRCSPPPHQSSLDSRDVHLSTELAGSPSHVGSPALPSICLNIEVCPKSGIDVNSGPANVFDIDASSKRVEGKTTRVNDLFWEQFLTEAPGSSDIQEVQSRRRDADGGSSENKPADHHKYCWNVNNVDNLTKQMGHLTPAGRT